MLVYLRNQRVKTRVFLSVAGSVSPTKAHGAEFFAVASGVQIPYVGRDETGLNVSRISTPPFSEEYPSRLAYSSSAPLAPQLSIPQQPKVSTKGQPLAKLADVFSQFHPVTDKSSKDISKSYLKKISSGLAFNEDVLHDRAPHTLPYREDELNVLFRTGGLSHAKGNIVGVVGRHDPRGAVRKHALCHLKGPRKLKPLRRSKTTPASCVTDKGKLISATSNVKGSLSSTDKLASKQPSKHEWDEFVLACLSKSTAQWIINEQSSGNDKDRLKSFFEKRIKEKEDELHVASDNSLAPDADERTQTSAKKEPKAKKSQQALETHYTPSFTLPSSVGSKKLQSENIFQQELLGGAQPVPSKKPSESSYIVLDTNEKLKFKKQLQENYPKESKVWYSSERTSGKKKVRSHQKPKKLVKGLQRWQELPVVVQVYDCCGSNVF